MHEAVRSTLAAAAVVLLMIYALGQGIITLGFGETLSYLWLTVTDPTGAGSIRQDVLQYLRLPNFVISFLVGAGLSVTGAVMQAVVRNPLADPYLLGVSSGASLGAVLAIALGVGSLFGMDGTGACAFLGAGAASLLILVIASVTRRSGGSLTLLLAGFALNAACSAAVSFIVAALAEPSKTRSIQFWMMGGIVTGGWMSALTLLLITTAGVLYFCTQRRILDLMLVGDELSLSMGRDLARYRKLYISLI